MQARDLLSSIPFLWLPHETLDQIMSYIDLHRDLMSFALTAKACARFVIPRHTDYRIIRIRHIMPRMWAHLARRADLSRNIREIHICERRDYSAPDHFPTQLIDGVLDGAAEHTEEWSVIKNICSALSHMSRLEVFAWTWDSALTKNPKTKMVYENEVFSALSRCRSLAYLALRGRFALHAEGIEFDTNSTKFPLWRISGLLALSLCGDAWTKPSNAPHIVAMLQRSPELQYLDLPMEFSMISDCELPKLRDLRLVLQSGAIPRIDESRAQFIEKHPTIERLCWKPIGDTTLSSDSLPSLKCIQSKDNILQVLSGSKLSRKLEALEVQVLDMDFLHSLEALNKESLQQLRIYNYDDLTTIRAIPGMFPCIKWLSLPPYDPLDRRRIVDLEEWLDILSLFPRLEVFRGQALWRAVNMDMNQMHEAIQQLVELCPNLRQLDHFQFYDKRGDYKRIVIIREMIGEVEHVRYEVQKPPSRWPFDPLYGAFD